MPTDAHAAPPEKPQELLYDPAVRTPTHAELARTLAAGSTAGTLATASQDPPGYPYASLVTVAFLGARPVFLISALAEHTKNLEREPRASLLLAESFESDALVRSRVTLLGHCTRAGGQREDARARFLEAHPQAAYYADFSDFDFWMLDVEHVRYIGGFGRMSWVSADDFRAAHPDPIAPAARGIITHMNDDHADALVSYCLAFSKATNVSSATLTRVDTYGFEMSAETAEGPRPIRIAFPEPITDANEARLAFIALLREARGSR